MTFLVERLAELRRHLDHLAEVRPRVRGPEALEADFSLRNDVLFSLLSICQLVIDIAGELAARRGARFEDYTEAIRGLRTDDRFPAELVDQLVPLAGLRNVVIHEYVALDMARVVDSLNDLEAVEQFSQIVARGESDELEDFVLAHAPEFARSRRAADADLQAGRVRPADEVFDELGGG